jgi:hypothetical protein
MLCTPGARASDLRELFVHFQRGVLAWAQRALATMLLAAEPREVIVKPELLEQCSAHGRTLGDKASAGTV